MFTIRCDEFGRTIEKVESGLGQYVQEGKDVNHRNLAQLYNIQWGHVDRHQRQIRKIKQHPNYPTASLSTK